MPFRQWICHIQVHFRLSKNLPIKNGGLAVYVCFCHQTIWGWTESAFIKVLHSRRPFTGSVQIDTGEVPPHGAARCCHYRLLSWLLHRRPKKGEKKRARVFLIARAEPTSCTRRLLNPVVVRTFSAEKETLIWVAAMLVICNGHREL